MENQYKKGILIAFGELFLKSKGVQNLFRKRLEQNLRFYFKKAGISFKLHQTRERILVLTEEIKKSQELIAKVFGISWFAECFFFPGANLREFGAFVDKNYKNWIKRGETFAIRLKSGQGLNKKKIIERVARNIDRRVNLDKPRKELFIEPRKDGIILYFKKQPALGGLPLGSSGKVLTLMSGGIDSPAAAYLAARRGAWNIWLHFHSFPLVSNVSMEKTKELATAFLHYQPRLKVYFIPFSKAQIIIKAKTPAQYRILLYRRLMLKIAEIIAEKEGCDALVTGESLGQVSSQTLPNLKVIEEAVKIPVLRPLVALDKEEIIRLAKTIGTYSVSVKPQEDCCTLFTPKHPTAHGKIWRVKDLEKGIGLTKLLKDVIKSAKIELY